jgi:hypothetical protein
MTWCFALLRNEEGWIELEVEKRGKSVKGYKQKYRAAAGGAQTAGGELGRLRVAHESGRA